MSLSRILIIEDEAVLRSSMARSLSRLSDVEVVTSATLTEGLSLIDAQPPALIFSDIDLPDRSGLELIGELGQRHVQVPIVFVSAYVTAYRAQIPPHANVEVIEKPVGIEELRSVALRHLTGAPVMPAPFGFADFLQLAELGRHSVCIEARGRGVIIVKDGVLWTARDEQGSGVDAFCRLAFLQGTEVTCQALSDDGGPQTLEGKPGELLLEAARRADEGTREAAANQTPAEAVDSLEPSEPVPEPESSESFDEAWERGVEATLAHRYDEALRCFTRCNRLQPDDRRVQTNLKRLRVLLFGEHV